MGLEFDQEVFRDLDISGCSLRLFHKNRVFAINALSLIAFGLGPHE